MGKSEGLGGRGAQGSGGGNKVSDLFLIISSEVVLSKCPSQEFLSEGGILEGRRGGVQKGEKHLDLLAGKKHFFLINSTINTKVKNDILCTQKNFGRRNG